MKVLLLDRKLAVVVQTAGFFNERPVTIAKVNYAGVDCRLQSLSTDAEMKLSINSTFQLSLPGKLQFRSRIVQKESQTVIQGLKHPSPIAVLRESLPLEFTHRDAKDKDLPYSHQDQPIDRRSLRPHIYLQFRETMSEGLTNCGSTCSSQNDLGDTPSEKRNNYIS